MSVERERLENEIRIHEVGQEQAIAKANQHRGAITVLKGLLFEDAQLSLAAADADDPVNDDADDSVAREE